MKARVNRCVTAEWGRDFARRHHGLRRRHSVKILIPKMLDLLLNLEQTVGKLLIWYQSLCHGGAP